MPRYVVGLDRRHGDRAFAALSEIFGSEPGEFFFHVLDVGAVHADKHHQQPVLLPRAAVGRRVYGVAAESSQVRANTSSRLIVCPDHVK